MLSLLLPEISQTILSPAESVPSERQMHLDLFVILRGYCPAGPFYRGSGATDQGCGQIGRLGAGTLHSGALERIQRPL